VETVGRSTLRFLPHLLPRSFRDRTRMRSPRHQILHLYRPGHSIFGRGQPRSDRECGRKVSLQFRSSQSPFILAEIGVTQLHSSMQPKVSELAKLS